jgi:hypothetical protein
VLSNQGAPSPLVVDMYQQEGGHGCDAQRVPVQALHGCCVACTRCMHSTPRHRAIPQVPLLVGALGLAACSCVWCLMPCCAMLLLHYLWTGGPKQW